VTCPKLLAYMVRARDVPLRISGGRSRDFSSFTKRWPTATWFICVVMFDRFLQCIFVVLQWGSINWATSRSVVCGVCVCVKKEREQFEKRR